MLKRIIHLWLLMSLCAGCVGVAQGGHLGFDSNLYPGDTALPVLRKTFEYTSYWLNKPPGTNVNSWAGKRAILKKSGFGFLVLSNGRLEDALGKNPAVLGAADGKAAAAAAIREGFAKGVLIFLDQEEGGRLTGPQADYLFAWVDSVRAAGDRAGVYCSGIMVTDESGPISTALDIAQREEARLKQASAPAAPLTLWVANDGCPPSPGCTVKQPSLSAGVPELPVVRVPIWQYAQSPRRKEFTAGCPKNYAPDGNCFAPGLPHRATTLIDLNVAESANPSEDTQ
jgi:Domain of unknown function (DUF1906)